MIRLRVKGKNIHSPERLGFWWSHVGWILCSKYEDTIKDSSTILEAVKSYNLSASSERIFQPVQEPYLILRPKAQKAEPI